MDPRVPKKTDQPAAAAGGEESRLRRWSRLKEEARAKGALPPAASPPPETPTASTDPRTEKRREDKAKDEKEKPFDLSQLPSIDSLTKDSDFSLFMRPEVPDELRQQALRRLWALDPALSGPDWFEMHMTDFNAVPTFPEGLVSTLYQVGKGYIERQEAAETKKDQGGDQSPSPKGSESSAQDDPADTSKSASGHAAPSADAPKRDSST